MNNEPKLIFCMEDKERINLDEEKEEKEKKQLKERVNAKNKKTNFGITHYFRN